MPDLLDTYIESREPVQPTDANTYGTAHGGNVTKWMDEAGEPQPVPELTTDTERATMLQRKARNGRDE